jgi:hypothetical protein
VRKVIPMRGKAAECSEARAHLVYEFLPALVPRADVNERRKLADEMLACMGCERRVRMMPDLLREPAEAQSPLRSRAVDCLQESPRCPRIQEIAGTQSGLPKRVFGSYTTSIRPMLQLLSTHSPKA